MSQTAASEKQVFSYDGINVIYYVAGQGYPILLLHGWGCSHETMQPVYEHLKQHYRVYNFDFPGFGESEEPKEVWGTLEYADMIVAFIEQHCQQPPVLIAHSFGGRISLRLGARGIPHKMVLTGCAGLKPKRGMDYYTKVYSYKAAKKLLSLPGLSKKKEEILTKMRGEKGSDDYKKASEKMRGVFVRVVNEDLKDLLPQIKMPVVLYWGELDTATPLTDGQTMEREMADAGLIVMKGATHYAYLERLGNFLAVLDSFLQPERKEI